MAQRAHYYEAHDAEYLKRLAAGQVGWDAGTYDEFFMRPFVARSLERSNLQRAGARALDLGCGTGALSCQLAEAGFVVTGIDISPAAIAFARRMAEERKLPITFEVGDVCRRTIREGKFNLIVDGHLLHCIVFADERRALLEGVRRSLKADGEFWVETMLLEDGWEANPAWHLDERGVVWSPIEDGSKLAEAVRRDQQWWLPQRLIVRSQDALLAELRLAGLKVLERECYPPAEKQSPGGLRVRCGKA